VPDFTTAAIVGAGVAGLACAQDLQAAGVRVTVYEKARGPGGRTSTRRDGLLRFDHGAQVLDANALRGTQAAHLLAAWSPRRDGDLQAGRPLGVVPVPTMSTAARALSQGLDIHPLTHVQPLRPRADGGASLYTADVELPDADRVIVAAPAPQAAALLQRVAPTMAAEAATVQYTPCWAVMVAWSDPLHLAIDVHDDPEDDLAWAAAQASRPGRESGERWVLQASAAWSAAHVEDDPGKVALALLDRFAGTVAAAVDLPQPAVLKAHRWRYSEPTSPLKARCLHAGPLAAAGDWCGGGRVAGAVASGRAAAAAVLASEEAGLPGQLTDGSSGTRASCA
jgi:renalase